MSLIEIKLPDEVMEKLPANRSELISTLSRHIDAIVAEYDHNFQRRVQGTAMGGPLSRYEKSILKDFILDHLLGKELREKLEAPTQVEPFDQASEAVP